MSYLVISPAYGRDYRSQKAVLEAWNQGLDFIVQSIGPHTGRYISKHDAQGERVQIRYDKLRRAVFAS